MRISIKYVAITPANYGKAFAIGIGLNTIYTVANHWPASLDRVLFIIFSGLQKRKKEPLIPLSIFKAP